MTDEALEDSILSRRQSVTGNVNMTSDDRNNTTEPEEEQQDVPPRLMITKMVLENFKSYAGVKEIGPFHKCFSAVVGPNGSGKSNVIDAMLFVFGKRAKKLRLNKVSELIHKSDSVKDNPPQYARVSVYFNEIVDTGDGDEDYRIIPNTDMIVTRIAKMDNSSTYKLNGKNSSFKEIANYLNSKGIDLDNNRFLILQGEVEMISMMPPKGKTENDEGLLEYLEDIIGSSKFVQATNIAAEKVDSLSEVRQEKLNRVKAVEREKDNLEGAKQEAEALLKAEREIRRKQSILYQINAMKADKEVTKYTDQQTAISEQLLVERERVAQAQERIKEIESGLKEQRKDYELAFAELTKTKEEFSAYERRDIKLRETIKHERSNKKKLEEKIKVEEKKEIKAAEKKSKAENRIPKLEEEIEALTETKAVEDAKMEEIEEETKAITQKIRRQLETKTTELAPVKQERAVLQASLDTAVTELKILTDSTNRAKERLSSAETELEELDEKQESKRRSLKDKEKELSQAKQRKVDLEQEDRDIALREEALTKKHKELLTQIEDVQSALRASGGSTSRSKAVQGILNATKNGGELSKVGVLGRLGDLATINEQYDVAVSTACGMLDHIVVQTTAGAQRCLEFLRKYNLGRASFIPLDKQKKGAHDRVVETPEGAPRLFDLITPTNFAVAPAMYLAVGNTLVAPDLETATRWAYDFSKRWRVVTLDGKLIETAGTMSGGGNRSRRGGMRLSNSRSKIAISENDDEEGLIETMAREAEGIQTKISGGRQRRKEIKDELRKLNMTIKSFEVELPKLAMEISGCDTTREELTKLIPQLRIQCQVSEEESEKRAELQAKIDRCKSDMTSCVTLANKLEKEVSKLQQEIMEAGGPRMKKQKETCEKILTSLNYAEKSLNSSKVEILSTEKAIAKAQKSLESLTKQLEDCDVLLTKKTEEVEALEVEALAVVQAYDEVKEIEETKRKALESATKEAEELKKSQSELQYAEIDLLGKLDLLKKQISESSKKLEHWKSEIQRLQAVEDENELEDDEGEDDDSEASQSQEALVGEETKSEEDVQMRDAETSRDNEEKQESITLVSSSSSMSYSALENIDVEDLKNTIATLQNERNMLAKNANMGAIAEYRKKEIDYLARVAELDQITEERNAARKEHEELRRQRLEMFMEGFGVITLKLKEMYQMITLGGDAELELVDSLDPFSEGIVFSVRPPKKSWKNISNLSGGEKTLSSLSLVFALHHFRPTPLYVMDEIDAALDFKNVSIVANYIKERTRNAQFIIISLRNNMFELADRLCGIYKVRNMTNSVTINPKAFGAGAVAPLSDASNAANKSAAGIGEKVVGHNISSQDALMATT
ncbi:chromosome segregation protein SMC [Nitzschia inconspicua]|uniref:Structural maintenance of chromosomes protein n=1 Tax=Nitzschia inconspicua TaxID=303405 RepID=A0A9K3PLD2_9STRA|nr:chromosome segregation protein SMC [Nitzschia inconspicua]